MPFSLREAVWPLLGLWALLRVFTVVWVSLASRAVPVTPREQAIPLWPPSFPFLPWLERATLAPWERWDTDFYLKIVERGYRIDDGTAQFHPLFPWLATPLAALGLSPLLALMLVSSAASAAMLVVFAQLARLDLGADEARWSTALFLFSPLAFALWAPYTEALFLLCAIACLLWARRGRWWFAGVAGAFAVLTRQQGVFLLLPLAVELWSAGGGHWRGALAAWRKWLALGLVPAGLLVWLVYRAVALGDLSPNWSDPQRLIYSVLISPSSAEVVPHQAFLPPWQALWLALTTFWRAPELSLAVDLMLGSVFVVLFAIAWPKMRWSYRIYAFAIACVSFGYHTGPYYPYMGLPRHLLLAFPVYIGLGAQIHTQRSRLFLITTGLVGILFALLLYTLRGWTP
jgi:hypothetical protein